MEFTLRLFGGFTWLQGEEQVNFNSHKQRCLVAALALEMPGHYSRERLAEQFWGWRDGARSKQSLRTTLTLLRKLLGQGAPLSTDYEEVWLDHERVGVDTQHFLTLSAADDKASLRQAAQLYQGDLLEGTRPAEGDFERWIADKREWYRTRALGTFVKLSELELREGNADTAIEDARRAVALDDLAEEAHRALLSALVASGRRGDAMRHVRSMINLFETALSVTPSAETMELIARIQQPVIPATGASGAQYAGLDGTPGAPPAAPDRALIEQRTIVFLSYEIEGVLKAVEDSTDPESLADLISDLTFIVESNVSEWFGVPGASGADSGIVHFGISGSAEDQASDAMFAALDLSGAIEEHRWRERPGHRFRLKVGIDESLSLVRTYGSDKPEVIFGLAELIARNICKTATRPCIVISDSLRERAEGYFRLTKYRPPGETSPAEPGKQLWEITAPGRRPTRFDARQRHLLPMVGRRGELELLMSRWNDSREGKGQIVVLRGDPGIGKSRLLHDFRGRLSATGSKPVTMQCNPNGKNTAFSPLGGLFAGRRRTKDRIWPLFERALRIQGLREADLTAQLAAAVGIEPAGGVPPINPGEAAAKTRKAVEALIEASTERRPLCIVIEDIHWADPSTLAQLEVLPKWIADKPVMIAVTTRHSELGSISDHNNALDLILRRLDDDASQALATSLWESITNEGPEPELIETISEHAVGTPLFVEELVLWKHRKEHSLGPSPGLTNRVTDIMSLPLSGLLSSRLDSLGRGRELAQIASVIGQSFSYSILRKVVDGILPLEELDELVEFLLDQSVLRQTRPPPDAEFDFRHSMLRETAYGSLRDSDRRLLHRRVFEFLQRDSKKGAVVHHADLALHAERAGNFATAASVLAKAGREAIAQSAFAEATSSLSHALDLADHVDGLETRQKLRLELISLLGPLIASQFGRGNQRATELYDRGMRIARERPSPERAEWFQIFWGWWYTGSNFPEMHERSIHIQEMLADVRDPEINLQISHCIWAIDFNLGRHRETLDAIDAGLSLYDEERAATNRDLFGGHDAKVCGLGQKSLVLWLMGHPKESDAALTEMLRFVEHIDHTPSTAHSLDTEAVSAFYRGDFAQLSRVSGRMHAYAEKYDLVFLDAVSNIFGGWATAHQTDVAAGLAGIRTGLEKIEHIEWIPDLPIYLDMQAALLGMEGDWEGGARVITQAIAEAERTGHAYWLAELYRRRAALRAKTGGDIEDIAIDLRRSLATANGQNAQALAKRLLETARDLKLTHVL